MNDKKYYVYILASERNGTLYTGFTNDLIKRVYQHKEKSIEGFTKKYNVNQLVYYEIFDNAEPAIKREKCIKDYKREWKINLIEKENSEWKDLFSSIC